MDHRQLAELFLMNLSDTAIRAEMPTAFTCETFWGPILQNNLVRLALHHVSAFDDKRKDDLRHRTGLLEFLGKDILHLISYHYLFQIAPECDDGLRHSAAAQIRQYFVNWLIAALHLPEQAVWGRAFALGAQFSQSTMGGIAAQVIAALYLVAGYERLLKFALQASPTDAVRCVWNSDMIVQLDPRSALQVYAQANGTRPTYEIASTGPPHSQVFTCKISLLGRVADGEGPSKKAAAVAASEAYLRLYQPIITGRKRSRTAATSEIPIPRSAHWTAITDIAKYFGIRQQFWPLMQRAMTTRGYSSTVRSGAALAQLGAHVFGLLVRLFVIEQSLHSLESIREKDASWLTAYLVEVDQVSIAWQLLPFEKAMLCPTNFTLTDATRADLVQAALGAALVAHGGFDALLPCVPEAILQLIGQQLKSAVSMDFSALNPKTALQEWCIALGLEHSYEISASGFQHARRYQSKLTVRSPDLGKWSAIRGSKETSMVRAEKTAAQLFLCRITDANSRMSERGRTCESDFFTWILKHLSRRLAGGQYDSRKWAGIGVLGIEHLIKDQPLAFWNWGCHASNYLPIASTDQDAGAVLKYYSSVRTSLPGTLAKFGNNLAAALKSVEALSLESGIQAFSASIEQVLELSKIFALSIRTPTHTVVRNIEADLRDLRILKGDVSIPASVPESFVHLEGILVFLIREITLYCLGHVEPRSIKRIEMLADLPSQLAIVLTFNSEIIRAAPTAGTSPLWTFLFNSVPILECGEIGPKLRLILGVAFEKAPIFPSHAHLAFLTGEPQGELQLMNAVSRNLHEMKNSLIACRTCISMPGESRTSQLRSAYEASTHLDDAHAHARSLRSSLLSSVCGKDEGQDSVREFDLADFMKNYALAVLSTLPERVRLISPAIHRKTPIKSNPQTLRVILDNLVKNALEAMSQGGNLTLDWLYSENDRTCLIEISDTGRGMRKELMHAILGGEVIASTKRSGSGIGMPIVTALLQRLGGEIEGSTCPGFGTSWTISIPTSINEEVVA